MAWGGWPFWYWLVGLGLVFLPVELYAAKATPVKGDTFSEFCWWAFGVKERRDRQRIAFRLARRFVLAGFLGVLYLHLVFGASVVPVVVMAVPVVGIVGYAVAKERS